MRASEYVIQFMGCMLQSVPVAFLVFLPFSSDKLRIGGKKLWLVLSLGLTVYGSLFVLYIGLIFHQSTVEQLLNRADMMTFGGLVAGMVFAFWNIKSRWSSKFFIALLDIFYAALIFVFSTIIINKILFVQTVDRMPYSPYNLLTLSVATAATLPFMWRIMSVSMKDLMETMDRRQMIRSCIYIGVELILFCVFIFVLPSFMNVRFLICVACYGASSILAMFSFIREVHTVKTQLQMEERLHTMDVEYAAIQSGIDEMRHFRHDMRHHFNVIGTLNSEKRYDELSGYLKQYTQVYENFEDECLSLDPMVNTLLKYYVERCRRENIKVHTDIQIRQALAFNLTDMTVLLGNCLENAINACLELPQDDREIWIDMAQTHGILLLCVENNCKNAGTQTPSPGKRRHARDFRLDQKKYSYGLENICLLYTSDAADE